MSEPFELKVEDVFHISGRGYVCTGKIASGRVRVGDKLVASTSGGQQACVVTGVEAGAQLLDEAGPGTDVGLLLRGFDPKKLVDAAGVPAFGGSSRVEIVLRGAGGAAPASASTSDAIAQSIARLRGEPKKPWWKFW